MTDDVRGETLLTRSPSRTIRVLNYPQLLSHPVEAESTLEEDCISRAILFPWMHELISQPFVLPVSPGGYTPDYLAKTASGRRFVIEVKLDRKVKGYAALFDNAAAFLKERDFTFLVLTEKNLRRQKIHKRALLLLRYLKALYPIADCCKVIADIAEHPNGIPLGQLIKKGVARELIFHLIASRRLTTGPRLMLDDSALVFATNNLEIDHEDSFARWLGVTPWGKDV